MELSFDDGRMRVDAALRRLHVQGRPQRIGSRAFELLVALARQPGQVVAKQALLAQVWPGLVVEENTLQVHVAALRRVLGAAAIATVSGRGYCLTLPADPVAPGPAASAPAAQGDEATLFGRQAQLQALAGLLADPAVRLLTLTGPGGSGKTRLALHATAQAAPTRRDGAWIVMLAPVREADGILPAIAAELGLQESSAQPAAELVRRFVQPRQLLLTLDNLEHLPGAGEVLRPLLDAAPGLTLLLTSRRPLRLPGEQELAVPPLALPATDDAAAWREAPALQLFAQRARQAGRPLAAADVPAAAAVCRRLDGLPLAIELAAARLRVLSPAALAERLQRSLPLLARPAAPGGTETAAANATEAAGAVAAADPSAAAALAAEARHQTLRGAIDWSHALLDPAQQRLFRRLAVFAGGWSLEGAEAVDDAPEGTVDRLEALLDMHLVQRLDDLEGEPRYAMLQTLREYALERLAASGEAVAVRERHARHLLARAEAAAPHVASAARRPWLARLGADLNNLRAALHWWLHERPDPDAALALAAALAWFWYFQGLYAEGRAAMARALALAPEAGPGAEHEPAARRSARAGVLSGLARLAAYSGEPAAAFCAAEASAALWRALGDARGLGFARFHEGVAGIVALQLPRAREALTEMLACFRAVDDRWGIALALSYLGTAYAVEPGQEVQARPLLLEGRARFQALGDPWGLTVSSHYLGSIALRTGALDEARALTQEMLDVSREMADRYRIARNLHQMAEVDLAQGRWRDAAPRLAECLRLNAEQRRLGDAALQLRLAVRLAQQAGDADAGLRFAALAARHAGGERTMPHDDEAAHAARVAALRAALDPAVAQRAESEGPAMDLEAAAAQLLRLAEASGPPAAGA